MDFFNTILNHRSEILLLGGDFSCVISQLLDRQPVSKSQISIMSKMFKTYQSNKVYEMFGEVNSLKVESLLFFT